LTAKSEVKRGRLRRKKSELVRDPKVQTEYELKLFELEEKYSSICTIGTTLLEILERFLKEI